MANPKTDLLRRLLSKVASKGMQGLQEGVDVLDTPGRATRSALGALQGDESALDAFAAQFAEDRPDAPSGADIAERFGEDFDVQSPAALAAIATAADVIDPTMMLPGGMMGKAATKLGVINKAAKTGDTAADLFRAGNKMNKRDMLKAPHGKVTVKDPIVNPGKVTVKDQPMNAGSVRVKPETRPNYGKVSAPEHERARELLRSEGKVTVKPGPEEFSYTNTPNVKNIENAKKSRIATEQDEEGGFEQLLRMVNDKKSTGEI